MSADRWTDRDLVVDRYSRSAERRRTIYEFRFPSRDWISHFLDDLDWEPGWTVVDAGCGLGVYFPGLRQHIPAGTLVGLDLTMVQLYETARRHPGIPLVQSDVQAIPIADAMVDVIVCAHMLYHVPDIPAALGEFHRILRPGGHLLAIYDSAIDNQRELDELFLACGGTVTLNSLTNQFSLENGAGYLRSVFDDVTLHTESPAMLVPEVGPVIDEINSLRPVAEPYLESGVAWERMLARASERVARVIEDQGVFRISEHKGAFVCRA